MSYDVFEELATDESLEENGTWFPLGKGARVLVARANNRSYAKMLNKVIEQNRVALDLEDEAADKLSNDLMVAVMAETILLNWEGVSYKGQPMSYSVENAKTLLSVKEFRRRIAGFSDSFEAYKLKKESVQGNA